MEQQHTEATNFVKYFFKLLNIDTNNADAFERFVIIVVIIAVSVGISLLLRYAIVELFGRIWTDKKYRWQELIFDTRVLKKLADIIPVILIYATAPLAFKHGDPLLVVVQKLCVIYAVVIITIFVNQILRVMFDIFYHRGEMKDKPLKGILQLSQVALFSIMAIVIISLLINKSPAALFAGLGASAAVMMLIFKDSIMGFVSGIQLSANRMLKKGDWICLPKYGVDGKVIDVTLTTVKVRNFDNTILTIPPYVLTNESFQNWQGMIESGGRRIMRSINIDISSIKFCTPQMIERYKQIAIITDYLTQKETELAAFNAQHKPANDLPVNEVQLTNIGIFREYVKRYLETLSTLDTDQVYMVRYLEATETGLPVQIYFFSNITEWVRYEGILADVMDHVLAVVQVFDLEVFQNLGGEDVRRMRILGSQQSTQTNGVDSDTAQ